MSERKRPSKHLPTSDEPKRKRLKIQPLRLTNLHEYALEDIFMYLDAEDLVNMVKSDDAYLTACQNTFRRKYGRQDIKLKLYQYSHLAKKNDFTRISQLLRYFGQYVRSLHVSIDDDSSIDQRFFHIFVTWCRHTLSVLHISRPTDKLKLNTPFLNVTWLTFSKGIINISPAQIAKNFPAVENLIFDSIGNVGRFLKNGRKISTLKSIAITSHNLPFEWRYHIDDFHKFIAINTQISEIQLLLSDHIVDTFERETQQKFTQMVPDHPLSVNLYIKVKPDGNEFKHSNALQHLKIPCNRIEHLDIHIFDITPQICDYIARCQNVKTLTVTTVLFSNRWSEHNAFRKPSWTNLATLGLQEMNMILLHRPAYRINVHGVSRYALDAIQPFLKRKGERLTEIMVRIAVHRQEPLSKVFDPIRSSIDSRIWTFVETLSSEEISFTLTKISV